MTESTNVTKAARRLRAARNVYLTSQVATLDLVELSEREATRLDHAAYRARRLAEHLGVPTLAADEAHDLYKSIKAMSKALDSNRARKAADGTPSEPSEKSASESSPPETAEEEPDEPAEIANFAEALAAAEALALKAGLPEVAVFVAFRRVVRLESERSRSEFMLESLFVSSVAQFEAFILRVISASLLFNPSPLNDSDRKFEFKDVAALPDIESFVKSAVDAYADSLMRESMQKWMAFLARATRSDTTWMSELLEEPMMRRHVHVHYAGRASQQYLASVGVGNKTLKLNDPLPITVEYLVEALDRMALVAISLSQAGLFAVANSPSAKKQSWDESDEGIIEVTYDLLAAGRNGALSQSFERLNPFLKYSKSKEYVRANSLHAKKILQGAESIRKEAIAWDVSSLVPELVLAKHCLLGDLDNAKPLFEELLKAGDLSAFELATWPILEPLRSTVTAHAAGRDEDPSLKED